jgi:hypothetical protein
MVIRLNSFYFRIPHVSSDDFLGMYYHNPRNTCKIVRIQGKNVANIAICHHSYDTRIVSPFTLNFISSNYSQPSCKNLRYFLSNREAFEQLINDVVRLLD